MRLLFFKIMVKFRYIPKQFCDMFGIGAAASGAAQAGASVYASERQLQATRETNELNKQLAQERNALEYQMFGEANEFNAEQAQLSRDFSMEMQKDTQEYNSIGAQIARARSAGVNPAAVVGGSGTTSVGVNSSSAQAQSVVPPNMVAAQMQTPDLSSLQGLASAFSMLGQSTESFARAKNLNADTQQKMSYNKFQNQLIEAGLKVSDSEARKNYAAASQMQEDINLIHKKVDEVQQKILLMHKQGNLIDEQSFAQNIENAFKGKEMELHIKNLQATLDINENQARWMSETFAARVYGVQLLNAKTAADIGLSRAQAAYFDEMCNLVETQNSQAAFDYQLNRMFSSSERRQGLQFGAENISSIQFQNNSWIRGLHELEGVVSTVGSVATGTGVLLGARAAMKRGRKVTERYNRSSGSDWTDRTVEYNE